MVPWKNDPDLFQFLVGLLTMLITTAAGAIAKVADDVKNGNRRKFWSKQLWLDVPAVVMMAILAASFAEYANLPTGIGAGVGAIFGWAGPRTVDVLIGYKLRDWSNRK